MSGKPGGREQGGREVALASCDTPTKAFLLPAKPGLHCGAEAACYCYASGSPDEIHVSRWVEQKAGGAKHALAQPLLPQAQQARHGRALLQR